MSKTICPYCDKEFKKITTNHLKLHNVTYEEYLKEYDKESYIERLLVNFFDEYYITLRRSYLAYGSNGQAYTLTEGQTYGDSDKPVGKLTKKQLTEHVKHWRTYGIKFPNQGSKIICFDVDVEDFTIVKLVYNCLIQYIDASSILVTLSGGKGYHIDIFLNRILDRHTINIFYESILAETGLEKETVELRGANNQGLKLPFGIHRVSNKYCAAVNVNGEEIAEKDLEEILLTRTKVDVNELVKKMQSKAEAAAEIASTILENQTNNTILTDDEIIDFEEMVEEVKPLVTYNNLQKDFIGDLSRVYREGFDGPDLRMKYILKIALFLKCHMMCNEKDTLKEMLEWMKRCKNYNAKTKVFEADIKNTVKRIFKEDLKLSVAANEVKISKVEIKEILSIKCRSSLQTRALRKLYYMMFVHSKAYADENGVFYMTQQQIQSMGAVNRWGSLLKQISKLVELRKIYKYPTKQISNIKNAPGEYKLIALSDVVIKLDARKFTICEDEIKCKDCMDRATDYLITTRSERQLYRKGKCLECPYNKR